MLFIVFSVFFFLQSKQQVRLESMVKSFQKANSLASDLRVLYLNNKNHLLLYSYDKDKQHLLYMNALDDGIDKKFNSLKSHELSPRAKSEFLKLLNHHKNIRVIKEQFLQSIAKDDRNDIGVNLNRYEIKVKLIEPMFADFSVHRERDLNAVQIDFNAEDSLF